MFVDGLSELPEGEQQSWSTARSEDAQERSLRLGVLCRVYEQADRVITGDPVVVNVVADGPAPAWSDGATITFNASEIGDMDLETLTQVTGLNYHELCHHLYTPRKGTEMVKWVTEKQLIESMNILEDQRIETLFTGRFPSVIPYLAATCARWLQSEETDMSRNYVAIRGRRYLPVEVREGFRDAFAFPELIPTVARIVDEYRLLTFPKDYERAKELIQQFNDYVLQPTGILDRLRKQQQQPQGGCTIGGPSGCGGRVPIAKGRPEPGKAQERDAKNARGHGQAESPYVVKPKPKPKPGASPSDVVGAGEKRKEQSPTQYPSFTPQTAEEALALREERMQLPHTISPAGRGHSESVGGVPLMNLLDDVIEDTLNNKDVLADVKAKQRVIVGGDGKYDDVSRRGKFTETTVPPDAVSNYRRFAKELQRLKDESEPTWIREMPSGKFNAKRVMQGCDPEVAFDRWDDGDDSCDIEAVILVDRSGSMSSYANDRKASVACWTIKRALEHIGAPVTVYAFDDQNEVAYTRQEKANRTQYKFIYGDGGTHPYPALLEAEQLLMSSRRKNKMLFVVTDGEFDARQNDEIIDRISKRGILTSLLLIMSDREYKNLTENHGRQIDQFRHGAEIYGRVNSAADLLPFAKSVVKAAIKKRSRFR